MKYNDIIHQWKREFSEQRDHLTRELVKTLAQLTEAKQKLQQFDLDKIEWLQTLSEKYSYLTALNRKIDEGLARTRQQQMQVEALEQSCYMLRRQIADLSDSIMVLNDRMD